MRFIIAVLGFLITAPCARAAEGPVGEASGPWREQIHWVPVTDNSGVRQLLYTRICRPRTEARARVVLVNHGSPVDASARPGMQPSTCDSEAVRWFLTRGYMTVMGMRRGYGETGGYWAETMGASCTANGYAHGGIESARDLDALVNYAAALPYARPDGVVVAGVSAGGWATEAYDSVPHPKVVAMINFAGGRGGHQDHRPNSNCRPDQLALAAGIFGKTATTPMLWVYAVNDTFFGPDLAAAMYSAFSAAGGKAEFIQLGSFGKDGHGLFTGKGGSAIWGPLVERYLASRGAGP